MLREISTNFVNSIKSRGNGQSKTSVDRTTETDFFFIEKDLKANFRGSHQTHSVVALKLAFNVTIRSLSLSFSLFQNIQSCFSLILTLWTILLTQTHTHT